MPTSDTHNTYLSPNPSSPTRTANAQIPSGSGHAASAPRRSRSSTTVGSTAHSDAWGSNFWVTLVDPQSQTQFYACPATGEVSWDAPVNNFVLPPSTDGEWWELFDESRNLPYYYHNKTQQTVWVRPEGFVIPLKVIQHTALGKRLSQSQANSKYTSKDDDPPNAKPGYRRSRSYNTEIDLINGKGPSNGTPQLKVTPSKRTSTNGFSETSRTRLSPIPGSDVSTTASVTSERSPRRSGSSPTTSPSPTRSKDNGYPPPGRHHLSPESNTNSNGYHSDSPPRHRPKMSFVTHKPSHPQSLNAALDYLSQSDREKTPPRMSAGTRTDTESSPESVPRSSTSSRKSSKKRGYNSHEFPLPTNSSPFGKKGGSAPFIKGRVISSPILNHEATVNMSPVKRRNEGKPMPVHPQMHPSIAVSGESRTIPTMSYPALPNDLASDILQFSESDYARRYFSTHKTGFMFRRRVPVSQMMTWQKGPLSSPLLTLNRDLSKDAVKMFKVIQHIMGDRDRARSVSNARLPDSRLNPSSAGGNSPASANSQVLEEERWLLNEGILHGELRDEIYCQLMKQLTGNPNSQSIFRGWQLLCVMLVTFPPSKNFETYLRSFVQQRTTHSEGRIDIMAKYCLQRLANISRKGPRGKPPSMAEIEIASDAAFNPSAFSESLDAIFRLQARSYPQQVVPIVLPFLADGILALGGTKYEGIFRVPGDGDLVSELRLRIDRGYYNLEGIDDPHVLASLLKLWLRELSDPLVPAEMYNQCITSCKDVNACVDIVKRLPTLNRRVILFIISFLQLFLEEKVQAITKMTAINLALVMAPNLLRCDSDSMTVVFTNAQFEQTFVHNLLTHMKCGEIDTGYVPVHGKGAIQPSPLPVSKTRSRRQ